MKLLFSNHTGIDLQPGHGVDLVADASAGLDEEATAAIMRADLILCLETLEHVPKFWNVMQNIWWRSSVRSHLIVSVPGIGWPYHAHPVDCYRFTREGLASLLDDWTVTRQADVTDSQGNVGHVIAGRR